MDYPQGINKVSTSVIDYDNNLKKHNLEAEKRLKKVEQDYLHTSQKYTETRSQWWSLNDERYRAVNSCYWAANFINRCNKLVEQLQKALDKLPKGETTEETIDHVNAQYHYENQLNI
jgi:dsDNA-specific endonuclease/ATPase MutS2